MVEYTERITAFIDVLGFKSHIEKTINNSEYLNKVNEALNYLNQETNYNYKDSLSSNLIGKEVTNFSDSFIISYDFICKSSLFYVIMDLIYLQVNLVNLGFLVRGSITIGDLYHDKDKIFGPAVVEAYELESKKAIYPRIILTNNTYERGINNHANHNTLDMERDYINQVVSKDEDEYFYVDYIKQKDEFEECNYLFFLKKLKKLIEEELDNNLDNKKIYKKYKWLKEKYNSTIKENTKDVYPGLKRKYKSEFLIH